jgi:hypothetical protein
VLSFGAPGIAQEAEQQPHASPGSEDGLGRAHMEISCSPAVAAKFDRALALLHNFWYGRTLEGFQQVSEIPVGDANNPFHSESHETFPRREAQTRKIEVRLQALAGLPIRHF